MGLRGGGAERRDDLAQHQQRRVDRVRLLQPLSFRVRVLLPLAARQVHQAHLALAHRGAVAEVDVHLDGEDGVRARAVLVHRVVAHAAVRRPFAQHRRHILRAVAAHHKEILDEEALGGGIPANLEVDGGGVAVRIQELLRVEQVVHLLVVDLVEGAAQRVRHIRVGRRVLLRARVEVIDGARDQAVHAGAPARRPEHRVRLARASLPVREDGGPEALHRGVEHLLDAAAIPELLLVHLAARHAVEAELQVAALEAAAIHAHRALHVLAALPLLIRHHHRRGSAAPLLLLGERPHAHERGHGGAAGPHLEQRRRALHRLRDLRYRRRRQAQLIAPLRQPRRRSRGRRV